jgi:hypothetical protein
MVCEVRKLQQEYECLDVFYERSTYSPMTKCSELIDWVDVDVGYIAIKSLYPDLDVKNTQSGNVMFRFK